MEALLQREIIKSAQIGQDVWLKLCPHKTSNVQSWHGQSIHYTKLIIEIKFTNARDKNVICLLVASTIYEVIFVKIFSQIL